jgi:hypothetical protein
MPVIERAAVEEKLRKFALEDIQHIKVEIVVVI